LDQRSDSSSGNNSSNSSNTSTIPPTNSSNTNSSNINDAALNNDSSNTINDTTALNTDPADTSDNDIDVISNTSHEYSDDTQYSDKDKDRSTSQINSMHGNMNNPDILELDYENQSVRIENNNTEELTNEENDDTTVASESIHNWVQMPRRSRRLRDLDPDPNFGSTYLANISKSSS